MKFANSIFMLVASCFFISLIGCSAATVDRQQKPPLLLVDSSINQIQKVAIVNVFSNRYPIDLETRESRDMGASLDQVKSLFGGDTPAQQTPQPETLVAEQIAEYTHDKIQHEFTQRFGWQFTGTQDVIRSVTANISADMGLTEDAIVKRELENARSSMASTQEKLEAIRQAQIKYDQAKKGVTIKHPVSYPGETALLVINRDQKHAARIQLASLARALQVDAVMAVCVYLLEKESSSLIGLSGKKPAVAVNMMMVDQNGKALITANKFKRGKSRIWWGEGSSSQLGFLNSSAENKQEAFNLYKSAVDAAMKEHNSELSRLLVAKKI